MEYELINVHEVLAGLRAGSKKDVLAHRPHTTLLMTEVAQQWLFTEFLHADTVCSYTDFNCIFLLLCCFLP